MFKRPISPDFSPNTERDDVALALRLLASLFVGQKEVGTQKRIEQWFKNFLNLEFAFTFSSGRSAFYFILKSLDLTPGDEVLIQAFTCVAVPNSITWAGLKPVYVDINPRTYNMSPGDLEKKVTNKSMAVVVQHTFGIPADIKKISQIAKKHNLVLIEDCAHSLGALYKGRQVGAYGDASFFSFGRSKVISSVFGGVVATNNSALAKQLKKHHESLREPSLWFSAQQLLHPIIYGISLPLYNLIVGKAILKLSSVFGLMSREVFEKEKKGEVPVFLRYRLSNSLARLALHQLRKLEGFSAHRRRIASMYKEAFNNLSPSQNSKPVFLRYPLTVKNQVSVLSQAKRERILLGSWYTSPVSPQEGHRTAQYIPGSCPTAERICRSVINLPTHINTTEKDAEKIIKILKSFGVGKPSKQNV